MAKGKKSKDTPVESTEIKNENENTENTENTEPEVKNEDVENNLEPQNETENTENEPEADLKDTEDKINEVIKEESKPTKDEIWKINWTPVYQGSAFIKTESYHTPIPMYKLPQDLQQYLRNMWFGTNVYRESKERLEKHHADMKMIEKLKKFISETFYN